MLSMPVDPELVDVSELVRGDLKDALRAALALADLVPGYNLPELLSSALVEVAGDLGGGSSRLVEHRPGSWEAGLVVQLAAESDWNGE